MPEEMEAAHKYIFEYVPNKYSVTPENLRNADAIEIKIGQGTKPGMGGHLPGGKVTPEIAKIREKPLGKDIISPSTIPDVRSKEDLKELVFQLRFASEGRPIGIKIAAGRIDLVMTGGFRISADIAKALAMGADAVALASAGMVAAACQQYRICGSPEGGELFQSYICRIKDLCEDNRT